MPEDRRAAALRQALTAVQEASWDVKVRNRVLALHHVVSSPRPADNRQGVRHNTGISGGELTLQRRRRPRSRIARGFRHRAPGHATNAILPTHRAVHDGAAPSEVDREHALSEALRVAGDVSQRAAATDPALGLWEETVGRLLQLADVPGRVLGSAVGTALRLGAAARADTLHTLAQRMPKSLLPGALVSAAAMDSIVGQPGCDRRVARRAQAPSRMDRDP